MNESLELIFNRLSGTPIPANRPRITLAYAQSLDASIGTSEREPLALSGDASLRMTHRLRSSHDAILVGIGTVLADNPRLTARYGFQPNPTPVVLDSFLRTPPGAALLGGPVRPLVVTSPEHAAAGAERFPEGQAELLGIPLSSPGQIDLGSLLSTLRSEFDMQSVMVEGGARIAASFLRSRLVDFFVLTIAPVFANGLAAIQRGAFAANVSVSEPQWAILGNDAVLSGRLAWPPT